MTTPTRHTERENQAKRRQCFTRVTFHSHNLVFLRIRCVFVISSSSFVFFYRAVPSVNCRHSVHFKYLSIDWPVHSSSCYSAHALLALSSNKYAKTRNYFHVGGRPKNKANDQGCRRPSITLTCWTRSDCRTPGLTRASR